MPISKTALRLLSAIPSVTCATLGASQAHAAATLPVGSPFADAALIAAAGGIGCWLVNAAPIVQQPFKSIATWLILAGTVVSVFSHLR